MAVAPQRRKYQWVVVLTVLLSALALFYPTDINHGGGGVDYEALTNDHGVSANLFGETKAEQQPPPPPPPPEHAGLCARREVTRWPVVVARPPSQESGAI